MEASESSELGEAQVSTNSLQLFQTSDLAEVCWEAVALALAEHPGRVIEFIPAVEARGRWDRKRLFLVVQTLLGAAISRGDPAASVALALSGDGASVRLTVSAQTRANGTDDGALDPPPWGPPLAPGLGLSLYLSRRITDVYGGWLQPSWKGSVLSFEVWLPR